MVASATQLFKPITLPSGITLQHRIAMAPMTRLRNDAQHIPTDLVMEHFSQRASTPGTLLITDATYIAQKAGGYDNAPGIYSQEQIAAWKKVTDAVHARGSYIFLQLWALGRTARPFVLRKEAAALGADVEFPFVAPSPVRLAGGNEDPRELTVAEIEEYVQLYAQAADNAVHGAGFDGVEIHGANGYLIDQFLQDTSNKRTDEYGGSITARAKFALDIMDAVVARVGAPRVGIRLSPWSTFQDMRMADPVPQFTHLISEIKRRHPAFAYLHMIEPSLPAKARIANDEQGQAQVHEYGQEHESNDFARAIWKQGGGVFLSAGEYDRERALARAERSGDVIVFGRWFISNPDLPRRIMEDIPLMPFDTSTFYTKMSAKGYIDYPLAPRHDVAGVDAGMAASTTFDLAPQQQVITAHL